MDNNIIIHKNVMLGNNVKIEPFCIIGIPPNGYADGELETVIGDNAFIRSHTVIYAGNKIGSNFNTGHHCLIREKNQMGDNVSIGSMTCIEHHIKIEDGARIHSQAFIPEFSFLHKNSWVGPNVVVTNAKYPRSKNVKENLFGMNLGENSIIGANSTILPGIVIAPNSIIGAGAVVTKDVPENSIQVGNPAKEINKKSYLAEY